MKSPNPQPQTLSVGVALPLALRSRWRSLRLALTTQPPTLKNYNQQLELIDRL
jgi:hypothetical protein